MLRIRSIHYDAFKSSKLALLSPEGERCWWRLQCLCDDDGRAEDETDVIAAMLFPKRRDISDEDVDGWLGEMCELGLIVRYRVNGDSFLQIQQWSKYQKPRRPATSKIPPVPTKSDAVATSTDAVGLRPPGEEWRGEGGESEGNLGKPDLSLASVDNPIAATRAVIRAHPKRTVTPIPKKVP